MSSTLELYNRLEETANEIANEHNTNNTNGKPIGKGGRYRNNFCRVHRVHHTHKKRGHRSRRNRRTRRQ